MEPGSPSSPGPPRTRPVLGCHLPYQDGSVLHLHASVSLCAWRSNSRALLHRVMWESARESFTQYQCHRAVPAPSFHPILHFLRRLLRNELAGEGRRGIWPGCWKAGSCREVSRPSQLWKARPHCIWDLFIFCEAFLWRDNAERMSINCRAKVRVSWPSSSVQVLAPSQQLSHEPSLQIIFPALHPERREPGWLVSAWPWGPCRGCAVGRGLAVQEELAFPLNHAGASLPGQAGEVGAV